MYGPAMDDVSADEEWDPSRATEEESDLSTPNEMTDMDEDPGNLQLDVPVQRRSRNHQPPHQRQANWHRDEVCALIDLCVEYAQYSMSRSCVRSAVSARKEFWRHVAEQVSAHGQHRRTGEQCYKKWNDVKSDVRRVAFSAARRIGTEVPLSELGLAQRDLSVARLLDMQGVLGLPFGEETSSEGRDHGSVHRRSPGQRTRTQSMEMSHDQQRGDLHEACSPSAEAIGEEHVRSERVGGWARMARPMERYPRYLRDLWTCEEPERQQQMQRNDDILQELRNLQRTIVENLRPIREELAEIRAAIAQRREGIRQEKGDSPIPLNIKQENTDNEDMPGPDRDVTVANAGPNLTVVIPVTRGRGRSRGKGSGTGIVCPVPTAPYSSPPPCRRGRKRGRGNGTEC